ncbi:hypothetical protein [Pseudodesulfovibrio sp.]|uniref:hypothetical protein n=1 Tax=Pseudodesulfovibrio sp. TaxID=2035812 RepID=UPI002605ACCF|nr:hypothetical protein [Pseudodesulfovibrio sp.]MDD3311926.1 hypothetical protein [Pseudodesulfovibrio sp.]
MHGLFLLLPTKGKRLPTSRELRAAGFVVSTAMATEADQAVALDSGSFPQPPEQDAQDRKSD